MPSGSVHIKHIDSIRSAKELLLISFKDIRSRTSASELRGSVIEADSELVPLNANEYFYDQIIGLSVTTAEGEFLGHISDIINTPAGDIYVAKNHEREYLIPAVRQFISAIDIQAGTMVITPIKGLLDV